MNARVKSALFVAAIVLRRRGAEDAGAIFVKVDRLDGRAALYGPAPQSLIAEDDGVRRFVRVTKDGATPLDAEERLQKEIRFDPDLWAVECAVLALHRPK